MKKILTVAALAAATLSQPVLAQSYVLVIGETAETTYFGFDEPMIDEQLIEQAAEKSCAKPFIRDLKGQALYRECKEEVRALAAEKLEEMRSDEEAQLVAFNG